MVIRTPLILVYWFAFGSFHCIVKFSRCFRGWRFGVLSQYDQTSHPAFQLHIIMTLPLDELGSISVVDAVVDVPHDEVSRLDLNIPNWLPNLLNNMAKLAILVIGPQFCYEIDGQRYEKAECLSEAFRKEPRRNLLYISGKPKSAVLQSTVLKREEEDGMFDIVPPCWFFLSLGCQTTGAWYAVYFSWTYFAPDSVPVWWIILLVALGSSFLVALVGALIHHLLFMRHLFDGAIPSCSTSMTKDIIDDISPSRFLPEDDEELGEEVVLYANNDGVLRMSLV